MIGKFRRSRFESGRFGLSRFQSGNFGISLFHRGRFGDVTIMPIEIAPPTTEIMPHFYLLGMF